MAQPITYWVQTSPIDDLTASFGSRLQYLSHEHKTFMLKCLIHRYASTTPMSDLVDELDPDAHIPQRVCDAIISLDGLSSSELLNLMDAIVAQLRSEGK